MAIKITAIELAGGKTHAHIAHLWWTNQVDGKDGHSTRAQIVSFIENDNGKAYVEDDYGNRAEVGVRKPQVGEKYLQTYADGVWTDNLLALPRRKS